MADLFLFMGMGALPHACLYTSCVHCLYSLGEGIRCPGYQVTDSYKGPSKRYDQKANSLEE